MLLAHTTCILEVLLTREGAVQIPANRTLVGTRQGEILGILRLEILVLAAAQQLPHHTTQRCGDTRVDCLAQLDWRSGQDRAVVVDKAAPEFPVDLFRGLVRELMCMRWIVFFQHGSHAKLGTRRAESFGFRLAAGLIPLLQTLKALAQLADTQRAAAHRTWVLVQLAVLCDHPCKDQVVFRVVHALSFLRSSHLPGAKRRLGLVHMERICTLGQSLDVGLRRRLLREGVLNIGRRFQHGLGTDRR